MGMLTRYARKTHKMVPICYICLRSNLLLRSSYGDLKNFYQELSGYDDQEFQFCTECFHRLKNCYKFKEQCHLAKKTLKIWKKKKHGPKQSIDLLYKEMAASQTKLSLSNKNNFKVYFYQDTELDVLCPIVSNSKKPHILTVNIPPEGLNTEDNGCASNIGNDKNELLIKQEPMKVDGYVYNVEITEVLDDNAEILWIKDKERSGNDFKLENSDDCQQKIDIKNSVDSNETMPVEDDDTASLSDESVSDKDLASESDDSNTRTPIRTPRKQCNKNGKAKRRSGPKIPYNEENFKEHMRKKIELSGVVKDDKGNVINMDVVFDNLNTVQPLSLKTLYRFSAGPGPFNKMAIRKLAEIHDQITKYDAVFTTKYISDEAQVRAEFEKRRECKNYTKFDIHCESCIKGFRNQDAYEYHAKVHHSKSLPYECTLCLMRFKEDRLVRRHELEHRLIYCCKLCPLVSGNRWTMQSHYNQHVGIKIKCTHCDQEFKTKPPLHAHMNRFHQPKHVCEFCAFTSFSEHGLTLHKTLKHYNEQFVKSEENTKCIECDITFISEGVYEKHAIKSHGKKYPRKYRIRSTLVGEKQAWTKKTTSYQCPLCEVTGPSPGWMRGHYKRDHPSVNMDPYLKYKKTLLCDQCGKGFTNITKYNEHKNVHSGTRPFSCPQCPKAFHGKANLTIHMERHKATLHKCPHCDKKFTSTYGLSRHVAQGHY